MNRQLIQTRYVSMQSFYELLTNLSFYRQDHRKPTKLVLTRSTTVHTVARSTTAHTEAKGTNIAASTRSTTIHTEARSTTVHTEARSFGWLSTVLTVHTALFQNFYFLTTQPAKIAIVICEAPLRLSRLSFLWYRTQQQIQVFETFHFV